jgi:chromosome segregation ATPase
MATRSLEDRVSALENTVAGLQHLPGELAAFRQEVNARFEAIDARFDAVDTRFVGVNARLDAIDARIARESEDLYARMRLLHEELVKRIKTIGEGSTGGDRPPQPRRRPKR